VKAINWVKSPAKRQTDKQTEPCIGLTKVWLKHCALGLFISQQIEISIMRLTRDSMCRCPTHKWEKPSAAFLLPWPAAAAAAVSTWEMRNSSCLFQIASQITQF
jgi:hypothetical protein